MSQSELTPHQEIVSIDLRISSVALAVLRATPEVMTADNAPEIALIELGRDAYTLGGTSMQKYAELCGSKLLSVDKINLHDAQPSEVQGAIRLLLGKDSLEALTASALAMTNSFRPRFGLVKFDDVWRMGGDMVVDCVSKYNGSPIHGNYLD